MPNQRQPASIYTLSVYPRESEKASLSVEAPTVEATVGDVERGTGVGVDGGVSGTGVSATDVPTDGRGVASL